MVVVNAGGIDKSADLEPVRNVELIQEKVERATRKYVETEMRGKGWDTSKKTECQSRLRFLTMREYLEEEDWEGELDEDKVEPWLR